MKKIKSLLLAVPLMFLLGTNTLAAEKDAPIILFGENGELSFSFKYSSNSTSRSLSDAVYEYYEDHVKITIPTSEQTCSSIYTELDLPEGVHLRPLSTKLYEKEVFLIENEDGSLLGLIDIPIVTLSDGTNIYGENAVSGNTVVHSYNQDIIDNATTMSISVYVVRPWSYYFYDMGYNGPSADKHDFWFDPISHIIISEKEGLGTYIISWNARDSGFRSGEKALSTGDLNLWNAYAQSLEWQYRCHYEYVLTTTIWNIEPKGSPNSYEQVVLGGCNL